MWKKLAIASLFAVSSSSVWAADNCKVEVGASDAMQYDKKELTVSAACKEITVTLKGTGKLDKKAMGHNLVISLEKDKNTVIAEAIAAGPAAEYLKAGSPLVIAATKMIGGGESDTIKLPGSKLKAGEAYAFYCTFPGHLALMNGKLIVTK